MAADIALATLSGLSSLSSSSSERRQRRRQQAAADKQFGIDAASIDFSSARRMSFVPQQAEGIRTQSAMLRQATQAAQARTEAELRVSAAAAGVAGDSVDVTISDTERTLATNELLIKQQRNKAEDQLRIDITDQSIQAEISKGSRVDNGDGGPSKKTSLGLASLDFLQSYLTTL